MDQNQRNTAKLINFATGVMEAAEKADVKVNWGCLIKVVFEFAPKIAACFSAQVGDPK